MKLEGVKLLVACIVVGALIAVLNALVGNGSGGAYLLSLVFFVSITQGCVALVAGAELSNAKWILPLRRGLLGVHPLLLFFSLLFLLLWTKMDMYPWAPSTSAWLQQDFFIARNFLLLLFSFLLARRFSSECLSGGAKKRLYAVLFILAFVISQSLIAFDWVMSLEYPWFSTLFGGYFFVEAFYGGISVGIFICIFHAAESAECKESLRDSAKMLFGFSLFWAGLFYAQYLVIWYGNLPEELSYLLKRISPPYFAVSRLILALLFVIPFLVLLSKQVKTNRPVMFFLSSCVLAGILLERILFIIPAAETNLPLALAEFIAMGLLFFATVSGTSARRSRL